MENLVHTSEARLASRGCLGERKLSVLADERGPLAGRCPVL